MRIGAIVGVLLLFGATPSPVQSVRSHVVQKILLDDKPAQSADVTVIRGSTVTHVLHVGDVVADRTRIDVPANVVVVLTSTGGKSTVTLERGASVTFVSTGTGELISSNAGTTLFSVVPKALDFFRVQSGESLTASVHGTEFSVDVDAGSVSYTCTQGEVNITKIGYIVVAQRRLQTSLVDVISAQSNTKATYHPSVDWTLARFDNFAQAEAFYRGELATAQKSGDAGAVNAARMNLGNVLRLEGRYADSLQVYRDALEYYVREPDVDREAEVVDGIALTQSFWGHADDARGSFNRTLQLYQSVGDPAGKAQALRDAGNFYRTQGTKAQFDLALQYLDAALTIYKGLNDREGEARSLMAIAIVEYSNGGYEDPLVKLKQAHALFKAINDRDGDATALEHVGVIHYYLAQYADALRAHQQALTIFRSLGDRNREAYTLYNIGDVQSRQGDYAQALASYRESVALFRVLDQIDAAAAPIVGIGIVEERQHAYAAALAHFRAAVPAFHRLGYAADEADAKRQIAIVEIDEGRYEKALDLLQTERAIFKERIGDSVSVAEIDTNIATIYMHEGRYDKALALDKSALAVFQQFSRYDEGDALLGIGDVLAAQGRYGEAMQRYGAALKIYADIGARADVTRAQRRIDRIKPHIRT